MTSNYELPEEPSSEKVQISIESPLLSSGGFSTSTFFLEQGKAFTMCRVSEQGIRKTYYIEITENGLRMKT